MGDSMANCKRNARVAEIETSSASLSCKKTRVDRLGAFELGNPRNLSCSPAKEISTATTSATGGSSTAVAADDDQCLSFCSDCSCNDSCEIVEDSLRYIDLKASWFETEVSTCINNKFRKTSPSSEIFGETMGMNLLPNNPPAKVRNHRRKSPAVKTPSQAELDDFFSAAEKDEQKRFAEKYNYDIVKDAPLEGRYQWVRLKP